MFIWNAPRIYENGFTQNKWLLCKRSHAIPTSLFPLEHLCVWNVCTYMCTMCSYIYVNNKMLCIQKLVVCAPHSLCKFNNEICMTNTSIETREAFASTHS